jgi:DUF1707 SHOCT-like domain
MAMIEDIRVSDADRQRVVELLKKQTAQGRLSLEELDERTGAAYAARTRGQLQQLARDLPAAIVFERDQPEPVVGEQRVPAGAPRWRIVLACCCGLPRRRRP